MLLNSKPMLGGGGIIMSISFAFLKHLNLPIKIKITIWQIVYIYMTAIFMNYTFAKLVLVWL